MIDDLKKLARQKGFEMVASGLAFQLVDLHLGLPALNEASGLLFTLDEVAAFLARLPDRPMTKDGSEPVSG